MLRSLTDTQDLLCLQCAIHLLWQIHGLAEARGPWGQTLHGTADGKPDTRGLALQPGLSSRKVALSPSDIPFGVVDVVKERSISPIATFYTLSHGRDAAPGLS